VIGASLRVIMETGESALIADDVIDRMMHTECLRVVIVSTDLQVCRPVITMLIRVDKVHLERESRNVV